MERASTARQVSRSLTVNEQFVSRLERLDSAVRKGFRLVLFGTKQDLTGLARLRLAEHAVHTWDVAVALDPTATIPPDAVRLLIDQIPGTAARTGRPIVDAQPLTILTREPERRFSLQLSPTVALSPAEDSAAQGTPHLKMPAEALIRLVYGRLDADHAPGGITEEPLDPTSSSGAAEHAPRKADDRLHQLRQVFPGF